MRADADEAIRRFQAEGIRSPRPTFYHGLACVLSGDLDGGEASFQDAISIGEQTGAHDITAAALNERALLAMTRGQWPLAEDLAVQARTVILQTETDEPVGWAVQARVALHRGSITAARQALVNAQRARPLLTYALPHAAVQAGSS